MLVSDFLKDIKSNIKDIYRDQGWEGFWDTVLLPLALPFLLGLGMSVMLAMMIVDKNWVVVFGLLLLVPAAVMFLRFPFVAVLLWMALMPFLEVTSSTSLRNAYWLIHRAMPVGALAIVVLSSMLGIHKRKRPVRLGPAELAMVLFLGIGVVNILYLQYKPLPYLYWFYDRVFVPMCLYLLIRLIAPTSKDLERLLPVVFFVVIVESGVSFLIQFTPQAVPQEWLIRGTMRGTGTFGNPYTYSMSLVFSSFLLFHGAMQRKPGIVRTLYLVAFGLGVAGLLLAFSRGTWLGAIIASLGLFFLYPKTIMRVMVILVVIMVILGTGVLSDQIDWARERLNSEETAQIRWVIWDAGLQMIAAKPLVGWGYGDYSLYAGRFQRRVMDYVAFDAHSSHNAFIRVAAELGLPALFILFFPLFWWLGQSYKVWPWIPREGFWNRSLLIIFWLTLFDHVIVTTFSDVWHSTYAQGLWWITLGLIANMVHCHLPVTTSELSRAQLAS